MVDFGAPGGIRTPDLPVRSRTLYPAKLQVRIEHYNYSKFIRIIQDINYKNIKSFFSSNRKVS